MLTLFANVLTLGATCSQWLCCKPVEEMRVVRPGKGFASCFRAGQTVL